MGLLGKIFGKDKTENTQIKQVNNYVPATRSSYAPVEANFLSVHPDIKDFLWIGDGSYKNYVPEPPHVAKASVGGITLSISFGQEEEPSLIYTRLPISLSQKDVERPPYFPTYRDLTPEQRGIYWKLLANPYNNSIDIGYVFILYYGLERHLLGEDYEKAIDLIIKLRSVHLNGSFQAYSANAIVLTCLYHQRADLVIRFMNSINTESEYSISDNIFLMCKYALEMPLTAKEIMKYAKSFEFTKANYIKNYRDLFCKALSDAISSKYKSDGVICSELISHSDFKKLSKQKVPVFANISIRDRVIDVPVLTDSFKFKKEMYDLLDLAHETVKQQLVEKRKSGEEIPQPEVSHKQKPPKEVLSFDTRLESELLNNYKNAEDNSLEQHFASIALQDFYYKYRSIDELYLNDCIFYCKDDISRLPQIQRHYFEEERSKLLASTWLSEAEIQQRISTMMPFNGIIPAFKRLAIVYDKSKDYDSAINVCEQAESYYSSIGMDSEQEDFNYRKQKILEKKEKQRK